jgi:hypothetical protein
VMSNIQSSEVSPDIAVSSAAKPERMLDGFPWVSAIVLYTLSWGWSLLRPNTLYWDDWSLYFRQPIGNARNIYIQSGRPLWEGLVEIALLQVGTWAICLTTFICFFLCSIFLFGILKKVPNLNS